MVLEGIRPSELCTGVSPRTTISECQDLLRYEFTLVFSMNVAKNKQATSQPQERCYIQVDLEERTFFFPVALCTYYVETRKPKKN